MSSEHHSWALKSNEYWLLMFICFISMH